MSKEEEVYVLVDRVSDLFAIKILYRGTLEECQVQKGHRIKVETERGDSKALRFEVCPLRRLSILEPVVAFETFHEPMPVKLTRVLDRFAEKIEEVF